MVMTTIGGSIWIQFRELLMELPSKFSASFIVMINTE